MPGWRGRVRGDPLPWLLEPDEAQPGPRYFALRDVVGLAPDDPILAEARAAIMASGPVPTILSAQEPEGFWVKAGPSYDPKYRATVWQVSFLAQLGADGDTPRVRAACDYILSHAVERNWGFSANAKPTGFIHCLSGNLAAALMDLGCWEDVRLRAAVEWEARAILGEGIASAEVPDASPRYYKSGTSGPLFACAANGGLPCGWGAVKALAALTRVPSQQRSPLVQRAIATGASFLLGKDPAVADYPFAYGNRPSSSWFRLGFPHGYVADVLENVQALVAAGHGRDPRLRDALALIEGKQDSQGHWKLEYTYNGKTWVDIETKGQPSKWVTLRALRALRGVYGD
ncbi:MAG: nitrogen fixation protein NifH [Chloroflexi bacterium]|nr:nitrogen fixation protein NifH [Chloroflexota bacterium]